MSGYRVEAVLPLNKKKYKISLEGTEMVTLSLYPSELRKFGIKEGNILSEADYNSIEELLYKRGKERALYYLKTSDKTSFQMKKKLAEGFYPERVIERILWFLEKYGYIDDFRYAVQFIQYNQKRKSYQQIKNDLRLKGICREHIEEAFSEMEENCSDEENPQEDIIRRYIQKKLKPDMEQKEKNKIIMALVRKGFKYDDIVRVLNECESMSLRFCNA